MKHQKRHKSIEFIRNKDKRLFVHNPGHFTKLKKSTWTKFLTLKKRTCPGKPGCMATLVHTFPGSPYCVILEEKLDEIGERLKHTPQKISKHLAQETVISQFSARNSIKLLKLKPYVQALKQTDPDRRVQFCNWVLEKVNSGGVVFANGGHFQHRL